MLAKMDFYKSNELQRYILKGIERTGRRLGSGSFGYVEEVIHAGALCAAKVIHDGLIDASAVGYKNMIKKIEYECCIMYALRHPNIVQFLGISFFENSTVPVLVMERLDANLESLLTQTSNLSVHAKINVLLDIAKGLVYLHSRTPPIVHRDLTARNVLLTNTLLAKIADLGNSRIIESNALTKTLSTLPGTLVYMPPEAMANPPQYDEKLDIFSFGHLALYTALQDFPCELLLGVYNDPHNPNKACARNEIERRFRYVASLKTKFGPNHTITKLVTDCLHNHPRTRPSADQLLEQLQKLQKEHRSEGMKFSLSDFIHNVPEEKVQYGRQPATQSMLERIQGGGIDMLEKEVKLRMGRNKWKQCAFQISDSTLQYFYRLDKGPEEKVPLDKITAVDTLEDYPSDPYQFRVLIDGGKSWKLKASSNETRYCWITALTPKLMKGYRDMCMEDQRYAMIIKDEKNLDVDAYAYVQMAPPSDPRPKNRPHVYQQLRDQNQPQSYASYEDIHSDRAQGKRAEEQAPNVYDVPKNQGFGALHLQIPVYDAPRIKRRSHVAYDVEEEQIPETRHQHQQNLLQPPRERDKQGGQRPSSFNLENMDTGQIQLLIGQLEAMGILHPNNPAPPTEVEELYPELDDTYDTISDEEEHVYDDISDPKPLYVNVDEVQIPAATDQTSKKVKPVPPPRVRKKQVEVDEPATPPIPRTKSIGCLLRETATFDEQLLDTEGDSESEQYVSHTSWTKARTMSSTVREDDPLLSAGENALYISPDSLKKLIQIGEGQFGMVYKAKLVNDDGRVVDVAIKTIRQYTSGKVMDDFIREMAVMTQLIHPNIINLYGVVKERDWIVLEYLPNGDLKNFLINYRRPIQKLMRYMNDVAMGMLYLSERGLIHRDLAARNVMVTENESCKVADFGLLRELDDYKEVYISSNISLCPLRWMAPESIEHKRFSTSSDVWSYGILLWEMFNPTKMPYPEYSDVQLTAKLAKGYTMPIPAECPPNVAKIMKSCWQLEPSKRPSFTFISVLLTRSNLLQRAK